MVSYYEVLGVNENSSQDKIRQAYRERMKAHHSDRHGQADDPIVRLITEAYRVLSNPTERKQYDKELRGDKDEEYVSSTALQPRQPFTVTPRHHVCQPVGPPPRRQSHTRTVQAQARVCFGCLLVEFMKREFDVSELENQSRKPQLFFDTNVQ
jgi:curved DNA-binding protein CbpA